MHQLLSYFLLIAPGFMAIAAFVSLVPRQARGLRLAAFVVLFVFVRDAMTPTGLWSISPALAVRFIASPLALFILAVISVGIVLWSHLALGGLRDRSVWFVGRVPTVIGAGVLGGLVVAAICPLARWLASSATPPPRPQGALLIAAVLSLALLGNVLEEVLFRGHLQARLAELGLPLWRVVLLSGGAFAICHAPLVFVLTGVGLPVFFFTLYEGCICAWLRARFGLAAASLAHGLGLFLLAVC